ncbi:MAG: MerR family transcriptional regulator [Actinomycetota bacterium]
MARNALSIGELARIMDVSTATIRSWEERYGWPRPHRSSGGHRRYKESDVTHYRRVARLRRDLGTRDAILRAGGLN